LKTFRFLDEYISDSLIFSTMDKDSIKIGFVVTDCSSFINLWDRGRSGKAYEKQCSIQQVMG
jgi:hypothetical protein